ncbi:MAG TPA: MBOAT family O-acyltransferase [Steroidobacteraceae bacterium]|nr:MBOAT family O-acyltransferase [Steroidobacteraceae bacterium]
MFVFLPVTLIVFFLLGRVNRLWAAGSLALASIVFYGYWSVKYIPLLLGSVIFNYVCGRAISTRSQTPAGRRLLIVSVTADLLLLGFYKYADFFLTSANDIAGMQLPMLAIVLPIGISFFTFTQIAFLVDAYRGIAREYSFTHYLLFATYFPHLIAGPILHHAEIMPQFESSTPYRFSSRSFALGVTIFAIGLAKKVLVADHFGATASPVFDAAHAGVSIPPLAAWVGVFAYSFQLYFDFSGYTDMAIGISKCFGVDLPINFFSPYKSASIIEFWQRWHMTLSRFLRDYLYFPLGGNRKGKFRRYLNLMLTMLLGGLWHGANFTFILWGGLHGIYLVVNHAWRSLPRRARNLDAVPAIRVASAMFASRIATFLCVSIAWVLFRANDLGAAYNLLRGMLGMSGLTLHTREGATQHLLVRSLPEFAAVFLAAGVLVWAMPNTRQITDRLERALGNPPADRFYLRIVPAAAGVVLALAVLEMRQISSFLYFQF